MTFADSRLTRTLRNAALQSEMVVVLTGAGISAESGIPTFRGKQGYWTIGSRQYHPQELATRQAFARLPREVWNWYLYRRGICRQAKPNPAHQALVSLERSLKHRMRLVTQNVDGLHLRAGNDRSRTFEIHGNIDYMRCQDQCTHELTPLPPEFQLAARTETLSDEQFASLRCAVCGAPSRPHVLWFDECYDEPLFRAHSAMEAAASADLLLVIGTSGSTNLPMQIGAQIAQNGGAIVDVNPQDGPFGQLARQTGGFEIRQSATEALPGIVELLASC